MTKLRVKSLCTNDTVEFMQWCRDFHLHGPRRPSIDRRFGIGFYQISQALKWGDLDNPNTYESFMASSIHLTCVAEALDVDIYSHIGKTINIPHHSTEFNYEKMLKSLAETQQMLVYLWAGSSSRTTRYSKEIVKSNLGYCVNHLISMVPRNHRLSAMENATEIMAGTL